MGKLTTHILDTAHGRPGAGVAITLYRIDEATRLAIGHYTSNADGRCDQPLLIGETMRAGVYELEFAIGDYFAALRGPGDPAFRHRRCDGALPRAAARLAVQLQHLPGQLIACRRRTAFLCRALHGAASD